ncbi:hypothetical protein [Halocola ammonii]
MKKTISLFALLFILIGCGSEEFDYREYFEARVNGKEFHPKGQFWVCTAISSRGGKNGIFIEAENCDTDESIILRKSHQLSETVYTSIDTAEASRPGCTFSNWNDDLSANQEQEIRLEITNIEYIEGDDLYFIEGVLDAVLYDPTLDSTVVISDLRFGRKF